VSFSLINWQHKSKRVIGDSKQKLIPDVQFLCLFLCVLSEEDSLHFSEYLKVEPNKMRHRVDLFGRVRRLVDQNFDENKSDKDAAKIDQTFKAWQQLFGNLFIKSNPDKFSRLVGFEFARMSRIFDQTYFDSVCSRTTT
jgi:hypothetical protein